MIIIQNIYVGNSYNSSKNIQTACVIQDAWGWYGEGSGKEVQDGEHIYTRGGFMLMYGKTNKIL